MISITLYTSQRCQTVRSAGSSFHFKLVHNRRPELELATVMGADIGVRFCITATLFFPSSFTIPPASRLIRPSALPLWLLLSAPCISNSKQICRLGAPGATFYERARDALAQIWLGNVCCSSFGRIGGKGGSCNVCPWHTHKDVPV